MTATVSNRKETAFGSKKIVEFDVALGAYSTGGISVTPVNMGMRNVDIVLIEPGTDGYIYEYSYTTNKIKAYVCGGVGLAVTVSAPTVTVTGAGTAIRGGHATGPAEALVITNNTATGHIAKVGGSTRVIPLATFGQALPSGVLATAPTFNVATAQGTLDELATGTLSTACHCLAIGD
jgi:hypothetical protein